MPEDIEDVFARLGLALYPAAATDLSLDCSCPHHAVPCKHLVATFYLLADAFSPQDDARFVTRDVTRTGARGGSRSHRRRLV
jgi:uncharacterized Zn finger protein